VPRSFLDPWGSFRLGQSPSIAPRRLGHEGGAPVDRLRISNELTTALRIAVADDNALLHEGIASLLEEAGHEVVGRSPNADDLLLKVRSYSPDIAIVDVRMPAGDVEDGGLVAAAEIRRSHADVTVLVLSQHLEPGQLYLSPRAVERHVQGIFQKLRLPESEDDNRRVLAVLALLGN
jgi:DNA-binding NarL/FixJ family response regulator